LSLEQNRRKVELKAEFYFLFFEEELYWFRTYEIWLLKEGNNTEYFHQIANCRKIKQAIFSLQDGDSVMKGTKNLLKLATE
jgi:hypothetical protein